MKDEKALMKTTDLKHKKIIVIVLLSLILFGFNLRHLLVLDMLSIVGDEFGYWTSAAFFAGYDWSDVTTAFSSYYGFGHGFALSILLRVFQDMHEAYMFSVVLNGIEISLAFILLFKIADSIFESKCFIHKLLASFAVMFYPSIQHNANFSWSETSLMFVFVLSNFFWMQYIKKRRLKYAFTTILCVVYLYWIHQRCLAIVFAIGISLMIALEKKILSRKQTMILIAFSMMLIFVGLMIKNAIVDSLWSANLYSLGDSEGVISKISESDFGGQMWKIEYLLSFDGFSDFIMGFIGRIIYFGANSFFVGFYSLEFLIKLLVKKEDNTSLQLSRLFLVYPVLSMLGGLCVSTLFFILPSRIDTLIYGRYTDYLVPIFLLIGLMCADRYHLKLFFKYLALTSLYFLFLFYYSQKKGLIDFFYLCNPSCAFFRQKMNCALIWIFLFATCIIFLSFLHYFLSKMNCGYRQYWKYIFLIIWWTILTSTAISLDINLGNKSEITQVFDVLAEHNKASVTYCIKKDCKGNGYVRSIQWLMRDRKLDVEYFNDESEIRHQGYVIVDKNDVDLRYFIDDETFIETDSFYLVYEP